MVVAKDGKWSWAVLSMVTFFVFLDMGTIKGISVLLPDMKEELSGDTWIIGSCISIIVGWGYVLGMCAGALLIRFDSRFVMMASGLLSSAGLIICAMATTSYMVLIGCILTGFMLLQENVALGIIPEYFDKHYTVALNVALLGGSCGIIVTPLLTQTLCDIYGWRGALLLLAGINMHSMVCSALLKHTVSAKNHKVTPPRRDNLFNEPISCLTLVYEAIGGVLLSELSFITQVVVPGFVNGYIQTGWMIYIVSFALSKGVSLTEASVVATCGGLGNIIAKASLPLFMHKCMLYKQIIYMGSVIATISFGLLTVMNTVIGMGGASLLFGMSIGMIASEIYTAIRVITADLGCESQYTNGCGWYHLSYGVASILSGVFTGLLFDATGSFSSSFIILAAISSLIVVSLAFEDMLVLIKGSRRRTASI